MKLRFLRFCMPYRVVRTGMAKFIIATFVFLAYFIHEVQGQANDCNNKAFGEEPDGRDIINVPADTYFLACSKNYVSTCCARIASWKITTEVSDEPVDLMIWRPVSGDNYLLVSSFTVTPTSTNKQTFTTTDDTLVRPNDCIGWHAPGTEVIDRRDRTNGIQAVYMTGATVSVGAVTNWGSATPETATNSEWAIEANVEDSRRPDYATAVTSYSILESTPVGTSVATVTFSDQDYADELTLTMSTSTYFSFVDHSNNTGTVYTSSPVSAINTETRTLSFTATDLCLETRSGTIDITIINTPPNIYFLPVGANISETVLSETFVTSFTCNDTSGSVTTDLIQSPATASPFFHITWLNDDVYGIFARSQADPSNGVFNYNTQRTYDLTIPCSDGYDTVTDSITVTLQQNQAPVILNAPPGTNISVDQLVTNGTVIFNISFSDYENDQVFFEYSCDRTPCPFQVHDSGQVQAIMDMVDVQHTGYDIYLDIRDSKNYGIQRTLTVTISGINDTPTFYNLPISISVDENTATGTSVFEVTIIDDDINDNHTIFWTNPDGGTALFTLDTTTGVVSTAAALNFEALDPKSYDFTVTATDGSATITSTVEITVNNLNEPLYWNSDIYRIDVMERTATGTVLPDPGFAVTDEDIGDSYTCYMDCGVFNGYYIMSTDCVITVQAEYTLDTGNANTIVCSVNALDTESYTDNTTLILNIQESNDFTPAFQATTYGFVVSHYDVVNTVLGNVSATDGDIGSYGNYSFSLDQSGLSQQFFKIDSSTGVISTQVAMSLCNCSGTTLVVPVIVTDSGGLSSTSMMYVTVGISSTTVTTTTEDWYIGFFEDNDDLVWFSLAMALLAIATAAGVYICLKYVCLWNGQCCKFSGPRKWQPSSDDFDNDRRGLGGGNTNPSLVQYIMCTIRI